jgi:hypothetical protein
MAQAATFSDAHNDRDAHSDRDAHGDAHGDTNHW